MTLLALITLPFGVAVIVFLLRGLPLVATLLSVAIFLIEILLCFVARHVGPLVVWGRSLELSTFEAVGLAFCAAVSAVMILDAHRFSRGSWDDSLALLTFGFFAAATVVRSMAIGGLLLEMGVVTAAMLLLSGRAGAAMTSVRSLSVLTFASMLFLLASWILEGRAIAPDTQPSMIWSVMTMALSLGITLALVPFHVWQPPVFECGRPLAIVTLSVVLSIVVLLRFNAVLQLPIGSEERELLLALLLSGGILTVVVGSIVAFLQRTVCRALAYAALADMGIVMTGLGIGTRAGLTMAAFHFVCRGLAIVVVSISLGILRECLGGDDILHLTGAARRAPLAVVSMAIGGFSLAGLPLTAGFTSRLLLYDALARQYAGWMLLVALCGFGPAWAFVRHLAVALVSTPVPGRQQEPLLPALGALALGLLLLALGAYPAWQGLLPSEWLRPLTSAFGG